tara:strand:+ start:5200 stop:5343 length:144 start_codon:yes stop_codon:yes gene_type:complete
MIQIINIRKLTDNIQVDLNFSPFIEIGSIALLVLGSFLVFKLKAVEA